MGWFLLGIVLIIIVLFIVSNNCLEATKHIIYSDKIKKEFDGFRILHLSDLHNKDFGDKLSKYVKSFEPDIIVLSGDMVSANSKSFKGFENCLRSMPKIAPIYYVYGNHELVLKAPERIALTSLLNKYNVIHLDDETIVIERNTEMITVSGSDLKRENYQSSRRKISSIRFKELSDNKLFDIDKSIFNLLVIHHPNYFSTYCKWEFDLVLTGHVHGGLIRLPLIGGVFSSELKLFPKYQANTYTDNNTTMVVSRGLGGNIPLRLNNRPEIIQIELKSK